VSARCCVALVAFLGCASTPQSEAPAELAVDVYGGLAEAAPALADPTPERVELVVDATRSMLQPAPRGATRHARARAAAAGVLAALEPGSQATLRAVGHREGGACTDSQRLADGLDRGDRALLDARLQGATPRSEASLAAALDQLGSELAGEGTARATRVVLVSDLDEGACGGDLCAAARALVERGAWLQVVPAGDVEPPACLAELLPSPALPPVGAAAGAPFTVLDAGAAPGAASVVAVGRSGDGFVSVPAGLLTLLVHVEPPERIGPFRLAPGASARVRLLDDRAAVPPVRTWRLERGDEAVGRAFPPPERLSTPEPVEDEEAR
jgi:hypothetical protein